MQRIDSWSERAVGDIFFFAGTQLIIEAEKEINPPNPPYRWVPSHAGILGPEPGQVVEAWLDLEESSAAAIHDENKYDGQFDAGAMQVWRPSASEALKQAALAQVIAELGPKRYGVLAIVGFEWVVIEEILFDRRVEQPVKDATVCSMTALLYLRWTKGEPWSDAVDEADCSPDVLLRNVEANQWQRKSRRRRVR
jgi:hypothetical protein